ncbi:hypothetical protein I4U23_023777 [Adineta vaga]|nr:hypothetical protein I4U23_023777 [Adineta vaga]
MRRNSFGLFALLVVAIFAIICQAETTPKSSISVKNKSNRRCQKPKDGEHICFCGKNKVKFDRLKGKRCVNGVVVSLPVPAKLSALRLTAKPIHQSARDDNKEARCTGLIFKPPVGEVQKAYVPLRNVSIEAWIDSFAADVTLTQVFVNREENPIEAIYVFPIEENAAVHSFTAQIDDRTITAVLKEKKTAEKEYDTAVQQGQTAVLLRQSQETLDTFTINIGALPPGKECRVKIQYVTELDLIDGNAIRFVVPTTIAPRYNPSLGHLQSPDKTNTEYVQKTPYSMYFRAHVLRSEQNKIAQVANLSHPVNVSLTRESIDISMEAIALDRDIILDVDLPANRSSTYVSIEQYNQSSQYAVLLAFTPSLADFLKVSNGHDETNTEFIFIVDCSGSMTEANGIDLAREAMLLFIRSLPVGSRFNIIRFGSSFDILFKDEVLTVIYNEKTAQKAERLTRSMEADLGGTELLAPLEYLKNHPPTHDRSRQIFLLTDGEISNTNQVIELCRSMSSTTRIFSFGLGHSPSRSLVKGLARATNGHFVFVPPNVKVDTYVGSQLGRALQPSLVNARLEWHGISTNGSQAPETIPPLYINDRILVYELFQNNEIQKNNVSVDLIVGQHKISSIKLSGNAIHKRDTIRRLAAKALIQELQHKNYNEEKQKNNSVLEERIMRLSLDHQILSPYTAFVGVESSSPKNNNTQSIVRHVPIQISKGDEHLFHSSPAFAFHQNNQMAPIPMMAYGPPPPGIQGIRHYSQPLFRASKFKSPHFAASTSQFNRFGPPGSSADVSSFDDESAPVFTTTAGSLLSQDPVRWFIDQQSFNGAWKLNDDDIKKLTHGKSLSAFRSTVTQNKDALSTAIAIAILESRHVNDKNLWYAVVAKGRKQLLTFGLNNTQVDLLIDEIKKNL